ncbi:MAG: rod shape-determining protein RodA [Coriobacteriia bacterium]|nr:rod shape-determining protein RodA [Coriobacteriia bacterium]
MTRVNERPRLWFVNWPLVVVSILLLAAGSVMVQSATSGMTGGSALFQRQLLGIGLGGVFMIGAWAFDYRKFQGWTGPLLILDALLILSPKIPGLGSTVNGATSWLAIGGIRLFQPSEPAKIVTILVLASVIASHKGSIDKPSDVFKLVGILAVPLGLILVQPDLGTGMVFVAIAAGMLLIGGLKPRWFAILGISAALLVGALFGLNSVLDKALGKDVLIKQYQIDRLMVFVDETRDPLGAGYNLKQAKIAIGSGEFSGKGLGSSTQTNLRFLPNPHTDFIFAVTAEEFGFFGVIVLLGLYLALLVASLSISASSRDLFGSLIAAGLIAMWIFQVLENIGMQIGLMPITGIPLPFMSFGSSFMVTNMFGIGLLLSVWTRRQGIPGI